MWNRILGKYCRIVASGLEACNSRGLAQGAWLSVHFISRAQKGRRSKTSNKILEQIRAHRAHQDGGHPHPKRLVEGSGLDGESGPERCLFHGANSRMGQGIPEVLLRRTDVPVQVPAIRSSICPLGLHQDPEANRSPAETTGSVIHHLHRRYTNPGGVQGNGSGPCDRPGVLAAKPRLCCQQIQVCPRTDDLTFFI